MIEHNDKWWKSMLDWQTERILRDLQFLNKLLRSFDKRDAGATGVVKVWMPGEPHEDC
jgi:hypothetical protein